MAGFDMNMGGIYMTLELRYAKFMKDSEDVKARLTKLEEIVIKSCKNIEERKARSDRNILEQDRIAGDKLKSQQDAMRAREEAAERAADARHQSAWSKRITQEQAANEKIQSQYLASRQKFMAGIPALEAKMAAQAPSRLVSRASKGMGMPGMVSNIMSDFGGGPNVAPGSVSAFSSAMSSMFPSFIGAFAGLKSAGVSAFNTLKSGVASVQSGFKAMGNAIAHPITTLKTGFNAAVNGAVKLASTPVSISGAFKAMGSVAMTAFSGIKAVGGTAFSAMKSGFSAVLGAGRAFGSVISSIGSSLVSLPGLLVAYGLSRIAKEMVSISSEFERLTIALDTLTKGKGVATFDALNAWAMRMPIGTKEAIDQFVKLKAYGLSPTVKDMTTLVDTVSALGGGADKMQRIALAIGQIYTKGRLQSQELRQLAEAGVPAYEIILTKLGLTGTELDKIGFKGISANKALKAIMEGLQEKFGGLSKKMMSTWSGLVETLKSIWVEWARVVMNSGPFQVLKKALQGFIDYLSSQKGRLFLGDMAEMAVGGILKAFKFIVTAAKLLDNVWDSIKNGLNEIKSVAGSLAGVFSWVFARIIGVISLINPELAKSLDPSKAVLGMDTVFKVMRKYFQFVQIGYYTLKMMFTGIISGIFTGISTIIGSIGTMINKILEGVDNIGVSLIEMNNKFVWESPMMSWLVGADLKPMSGMKKSKKIDMSGATNSLDNVADSMKQSAINAGDDMRGVYDKMTGQKLSPFDNSEIDQGLDKFIGSIDEALKALEEGNLKQSFQRGSFMPEYNKMQEFPGGVGIGYNPGGDLRNDGADAMAAAAEKTVPIWENGAKMMYDKGSGGLVPWKDLGGNVEKASKGFGKLTEEMQKNMTAVDKFRLGIKETYQVELKVGGPNMSLARTKQKADAIMKAYINSITGGGSMGKASAIFNPLAGIMNSDRGATMTPNYPHFASGGVVGGGPGSSQLAVVHGGEVVFTQGQLRALAQSGGSNGRQDIHTHLEIGGREFAKAVTRVDSNRGRV